MLTPQVSFRKVSFLFSDQEITQCVEWLHGDGHSYGLPLIISDNIKAEKKNALNQRVVPVMTQQAANQFLGQELDCIVYDARADFDVNAFAAVTGCIVSGGHLFMLLPQSLTAFQTLSREQDLNSRVRGNCLIRLLGYLQKISVVFKSSSDLSCWTTAFDNEPSRLPLSDEFFDEQTKVIKQIKRVSLGHAKRPLVITGARGRGKSSALALAVADLVFEHKKKILVTAPRKANLQIFFQQLNKRLTALCENMKELDISLEDRLEYAKLKKMITYLPPDQLILGEKTNQLVIVEEAGSIPLQMLEKISALTTRCIYSTTTDGYEGNGQGFKLQFKPFLNEHFTQWNSCRLIHPARFMVNDPLEIAINKALLLSNDPIICDINNFCLEQVVYRKVEQQELRENNALLKKIYHLLLTAHYQTRPSDLERILSDPNLSIFVAAYDEHILCASLVVKEGGMSVKQCSLIDTGELRTSGHLIPQSMIAHQGVRSAGLLDFWRIMRIATNRDFRNHQIASQLIEYIANKAHKASIDILAASFALSQQVIHFWYQQSFLCNRIGIRKDSSTGKFSCEFIRLIAATKQTAKECHQLTTMQFSTTFFHFIKSNYLEVDPQVLVKMIIQQIANAKPANIKLTRAKLVELSAEDVNYSKHEIKQYLKKARSFEMVEWHLYQFVRSDLLKRPPRLTGLADLKINLLFRKLLQQVSWGTLVSEYKFVGKEAAQNSFRESIKKIFNAPKEHS